MRRVLMAAGSLLLCAGLAGSVWATPTTPGRAEAEASAIDKSMDEAFSEMMKPGPVEPGWSKGGVDIDAAIRGKPGGAAKNYLLTIDKDGDRTLEIYAPDPVQGFVPVEWRLVSQTGSVEAVVTNSILGFGSFDKRYHYVIRTRGSRVGDTFCDDLVGAQLYEDPTKSADMPAEVALGIFNFMARRTSGMTICTKYEGKGPDYSYRYYLTDGRSLPGLNEEGSVSSVVPAAPVIELLKAN